METPDDDDDGEDEKAAETPDEDDDEGEASAEAVDSIPAQAGDGTINGEESVEEGTLIHEPVKKADVKKGLKCAYLETDTGELERCTITKKTNEETKHDCERDAI